MQSSETWRTSRTRTSIAIVCRLIQNKLTTSENISSPAPAARMHKHHNDSNRKRKDQKRKKRGEQAELDRENRLLIRHLYLNFTTHFSYLSRRMEKSLNAVLQQSARSQRHSYPIQCRHDSLNMTIKKCQAKQRKC